MTTIVSWPYRRTDCRYIHELYASMRTVAADLQVSDYRPGRFWRSAPDILHLHWPETAVNHSFYPRALLRGCIVLVDILLMKVRGTSVVWTRHDDGSHMQTHPRTERIFTALYERLTDAFIHMSEGSQATFVPPGSAVETMIPHGFGPVGSITVPERKAAKLAMGLDDAPVIGIVGRLQPYKNVLEVIDAFARLGHGQLLVAGAPIGEEYLQELQGRSDTPGLVLELGRLTEERFQQALRACDVVVLSYRNHLNSGVAFEALAAPSRIGVTKSAATEELAEAAGAEWVRLIDGLPTPEQVDSLLRWASEPTPEGIPMEDSWSTVGAQTELFLRSLHTRP